MRVFDRFEKGVERALNGAFAKVFRSDLKPIELSAALKKKADEQAVAFDRNRTVIPNDYIIYLSTEDYQQVEQWGITALVTEFQNSLASHAEEQNYVTVGTLTVTLSEDPSLSEGNFYINSETRRNELKTQVSHNKDRYPMLDIDGQRYLLTGHLTVLGRGVEADIVIDDNGVSRRHLEIKVTPERVTVTDLKSTNGLYVEGRKTESATLVDGNTLTIGRTRILYWAPAGQTSHENW